MSSFYALWAVLDMGAYITVFNPRIGEKQGYVLKLEQSGLALEKTNICLGSFDVNVLSGIWHV